MRGRLSRLTIQHKIMLLVGATATLAVVAACGALLVLELSGYRQKVVGEIEGLADVMSADSTASLVFNDRPAAERVLASLARHRHIVGASILGRDYVVFAAYGEERQTMGSLSTNRRDGQVPNDRVVIVHPLSLDGEHVGDLRLVSDLADVKARLSQYAMTLLFVVTGALGLALLVGGRMQRTVSAPIVTELKQRLTDLQTEMAERRSAEATLQERDQQLRQAQKMEAIGRLAGGVAHDFNNLLTAIQGYGELAAAASSDNEDVRGYLKEVITAAERAAGLTTQLLAFSRKQIISPAAIDLCTIIRDNEKMLRRLIREDVELRTRLSPDLHKVLADAGQLTQVLMNLCVNASDAMPDGGTLTIETQDVYLDEGYATLHPEVPAGDYVTLVVTDTGIGMDEATRVRIFEPFFTTKGVGKGTGLGLATVYGIVHQSGGHIWVYSEPNKGTTFRVYLPAFAGEAGVAEARRETREVPGGHETVLLVEDEAQVRKLAAITLRARGYQVLEAPHGDAALDLSRQHTGGIDLVVTDVIMPKMNGRELIDRMRSDRPHVKVLFMSGYTDTAIVRQGVLDPGVQLLQKPFSSLDLARRVRDMLGAPA